MPGPSAPSPATDRSTAVRAALRARIHAIERGYGDADNGGAAPPGVPFPAFADALPDGRLPRACVHEVVADGARGAGTAGLGAATGFVVALLGLLAGDDARPVLWCLPAAADDLYGPGLAAGGLGPARLILLRTRRDDALLAAMEEALRCPALAAVVAEPRGLDLTAGRRLQLAAEAGRVTGIVLPRTASAGAPVSAAVTQWAVAPAAGGLARPRWQVALRRCRGGRPTQRLVEWDHATGALAVAAAVRGGAALRRQPSAAVG